MTIGKTIDADELEGIIDDLIYFIDDLDCKDHDEYEDIMSNILELKRRILDLEIEDPEED